MAKKPMKLRTTIITSSIALLFSTALIVGTAIAYNYENLLDVYFSRSDYQSSKETKALCEEVAAEGIVLLKNEDNALPLKVTEKTVALYGQNSVDFVYGGSGSGAIDATTALNLKQAFEEVGYSVNQTLWNFYAVGPGSGYRKTTPDETGAGVFAVNEVPLSVFTDQVKNSLTDDVGIVVIGRSGGESADLPTTALSTGALYLQLDQNEKDTLALACSKHNKVIMIINSNNPLELGFLEEEAYSKVKGAIWIGGVGQEGIRAIPKVIKGMVNPSGRLVDTYAYDSKSAPSVMNFGDNTIVNSAVNKGDKYIVFAEGIYVGYRYYETRYEDVVLNRTSGFDYKTAVQYPFGYGLSYTEFEWDKFTVHENSDGKSYVLSVEVTNVGDVEGKDVVEFYVQKPYTPGGIEVSSIELVEFGKTDSLKAGEKQIISVNVPKTSLTSYDYLTNKTYILNEGDFYFAAGRNAHDALNNVLAKKGKSTADGMTSNGDESLANLVFNNPSVDATSFNKSSVTNKSITNVLDDANLQTYDASFNYLSRNDWHGTYPNRYQNGSWTAPDALLENLQFFNVNSDTSDDETIATHNYPVGSTATSYVVKDLIGVSKDDQRWDDIVSQLSYNQQTRLIRMGGYSTVQLDRIGLPSTQDKDGPSGISSGLVGGVATMAWPAEVVMASTWNKPLIEEVGVAFGNDSIIVGVAGVYGPGANIHRSPYSGRNFEYYSEDPLLSYKICAFETKGLRSKGVITYTKHFALNDQETNRYGGAVFANEQAIREIFLRGFEGSVVEGGTNALMVAMNRVGSRWAGANKGLMTSILRDEWGFEGFCITDQASVPAMFYQDIVSGLWAGTDMWLNTSSSYWSLDAYANDPTMKYYIHNAAKNIVYSITNSWAVNDNYRYNSSGQKTQTTAYIIPWRAIIWSMDGVIWGVSTFLITFTTVKYVLGRKRRKLEAKA